MKATHWFFINSKLLEIYTYGPKNHPSQTYHFEDVEEFRRAVEAFKNDGHEFIKDQAG